MDNTVANGKVGVETRGVSNAGDLPSENPNDHQFNEQTNYLPTARVVMVSGSCLNVYEMLSELDLRGVRER